MDHGYAVLIQRLYRPQGSQVGGNQGNCSWGCHGAKISNRMLCKTEEYHRNIETLQLFLWIMPSYHLLYGNVCKGLQINLRCTLKGCQPLKRYIYIYINVLNILREKYTTSILLGSLMSSEFGQNFFVDIFFSPITFFYFEKYFKTTKNEVIHKMKRQIIFLYLPKIYKYCWILWIRLLKLLDLDEKVKSQGIIIQFLIAVSNP